ncbi:alpha-xenorhabdolysin family binary toxin subunit B [Pseudomonas sp. NPDC089392]|uniref:alpha-xenorhabdolysin family binary toxin subunit B n=1 Tax=Pseudomonas sp. NPDC089392 TaxID=3364459 RepID=UPI0038133A38
MDVVNVKLAMPDFVRMSTVHDQLLQLIDTWDIKVLPAAREQLDELRALLPSVERSFLESLVGAIVLLENREFPPRAQGAVTDSRLASVLARLDQQHALLVRQNLRLELFSLSALGQYVGELENRTAQLGREVGAFKERLVRLRQQRADIVQALELFEKPSVANALKGLIPSEDDIDRVLGLIKDPKIDSELFKAVTQKLNSHIDALEGAKTFSDLSKARARLDVKIKESLGDQAYVQQSLQVAQDELQAVKALSGLELLKEEWLRELRKVEHEWQAQAGQLSALMDLEVATLALKDLCTYLMAVQIAYDRS